MLNHVDSVVTWVRWVHKLRGSVFTLKNLENTSFDYNFVHVSTFRACDFGSRDLKMEDVHLMVRPMF